MVCFDSDVLISFLRNNKETVNHLEKLKKEGKKFSTTSINSFELLKGIPKSSKLDKEKVLEFLNNFNIYYFDFESSKIASEIYEELKSKGDLIELPDIMIASIVISNSENIITENIVHFKRIKDLNIEELK